MNSQNQSQNPVSSKTPKKKILGVDIEGLIKQYLPLAQEIIDKRIDEKLNPIKQDLEKIKNLLQTALTPPATTETNPQEQTNPQPQQDPVTANIMAGIISKLLGGGSSEILPKEVQQQILANIMANALNPPDRFGDFLKGFNTALRTMYLMTRKKTPSLGGITFEHEEE